MALEAIEPRRLYRQVADRLRAHIESGAAAIGDRLPTERELADRLGVSRPTIREALIALEVEGRVRIRVGSGIYVCEPPAAAPEIRSEPEGPFEVLSARAFLEGAIAAEAALRIDPAALRELDALLAAMADVQHPSDEAVMLDRAFHLAIAGVPGNSVIVRTVRELFDQRMTAYFGRLAQYFENASSWRAALDEHRAIRDALAARDAERARRAVQLHLERSAERFSISFGEAAPEGEPGFEKRRRASRRAAG